MNTCLASYPETNSKHWFTTSFLWRRVPESDARSVPPSVEASCTCIEIVFYNPADTKIRQPRRGL